MKIYFGLILIVSIAFWMQCDAKPVIRKIPYDLREEIVQNVQECRAYLDGEAIANLKIHNLVENDAMKNFLFCMHKKGGTQNTDGSYNKEVLKKRVAELTGSTVYENIIDECTQEDHLSGVENAWAWSKCAKDKFKNIRFY